MAIRHRRCFAAEVVSKSRVVPNVIQTAGEMSTLTCLVAAGVDLSIVPASAAKRISASDGIVTMRRQRES